MCRISRLAAAIFLAAAALLLEAGRVSAHDGTPHPVTWRDWHFVTLAVLLVVTLIYLRGVIAVRQRTDAHHGAKVWQVGCFLSGMLALSAALASPIEALSVHLFWVHMVQHLLLIVAAAPLLVISSPLVPLLWALPRSWRLAFARFQHVGW